MQKSLQSVLEVCPGTPITCAALNKESEFLICGTDYQKLVLCNPWSSLVLHSFKGGHSEEISSCSFDEANRHIVSSGLKDGYACIWDVTTGGVVRKLGQTSDVRGLYACGFWVDNLAYTGGADGGIKLWDLRESGKKATRCLKPAYDSITCIQPMETPTPALLMGSLDGIVRYFDLRAGWTYDEWTEIGAVALALSSDKNHLCYAIACKDGIIYLRERRLDWRNPVEATLDEMEMWPLNEFKGHKPLLNLHQIALSPSGKEIWSPTGTSSLRSWELICQDSTKNFVDHALSSPATGCTFVKDDLATLRRQPRSGCVSGAVIAWCRNGTISVFT